MKIDIEPFKANRDFTSDCAAEIKAVKEAYAAFQEQTRRIYSSPRVLETAKKENFDAARQGKPLPHEPTLLEYYAVPKNQHFGEQERKILKVRTMGAALDSLRSKIANQLQADLKHAAAVESIVQKLGAGVPRIRQGVSARIERLQSNWDRFQQGACGWRNVFEGFIEL